MLVIGAERLSRLVDWQDRSTCIIFGDGAGAAVIGPGEGYRKALRLMKEAEKFKRPIVTFIGSSGAYCGIDAEERGQGEAIAENLFEMMGIKTGNPLRDSLFSYLFKIFYVSFTSLFLQGVLFCSCLM